MRNAEMMSRGSKSWGLSEQVIGEKLLVGPQKVYKTRERELVSLLVFHWSINCSIIFQCRLAGVHKNKAHNPLLMLTK